MNTRTLLKHLLTGLFGSLLMMQASAQTFPNKNITIMVPYPAGGASDAVARLVQAEYEKQLGQKMLVENLGGVSGALGIQKVLAAPADGYFQLLGTPMELVMAPLAYTAVKFKPEELRMASLMGRTTIAFAVRKDIPATNVEEFLQWAKGRRVTYASIGQGSLYHVMGERFKVLTGLDMVHVPYKSGLQILTDLGGNQVDMTFTPLAGPTPGMIKDGRFRLLGLTSSQPHPLFPQVQTVSSHPRLSDFVFDIWVGLQVAKSTPTDVVQKLNRAMNEAVKSETFVRGMTTTGSQIPPAMSVSELDQFYSREVERYRALFKAANIEPQ